MSSTTNQVGMVMSIMTQSTAATVSSVADLRQNGDKASASFDNILNQVSENVIQTQDTNFQRDMNKRMDGIKPEQDIKNNDNKPKDIDKADANKTEDEHAVKDTDKDVDRTDKEIGKETTDVKETNSTEADEKLQEAINENGREIISKIAEVLDLSEDEVINTMQMLGFVPADLLNPENLQNLVQNMVGQDKALDLITDSDLYTSLQDLMEGAESMRSELMNEFDLSQEDLQAAIEDTSKGFKEMIQQEKAPEVILNEAGEELKRDIGAPQSDKTSDIRAEVISDRNSLEDKRPVEMTSRSSDSGNENHGNFGQDTGTNLFNQLVENITEAVNANPTSEMQYTDRAQMENIIRQITDRITVIRAEDETSMELQLHPASLGNVNILLTSGKDGIVAKFTAQNEMVKEAVESQMVQLQQKFEERGIKVTSVEVTIESRAFEQNMNNQGQNQEFAEQNSERRPLRRINLAQVSGLEDEEEIDEIDKITAQMMAANGNTVDFSA